MRTCSSPLVRLTAALALLTSLGGCLATQSGVALPEISKAREALREAEEAGAADEPSAQIYVALAQEHLQRASGRLAQGDRDGAVGLARRAEADAEVALLTVRDASLRDAVQRTVGDTSLLSDQAAKIDLAARKGAER
ncbi:DUF4398 domain-containing protein [Chondromyces crocatus]|uniref:DUF4398 domain-containing protein n=1 Tax=Chondromyces crocatus TaxID=52 RepID=A0A0K1EAW0_CHOCO|nr:DUF4398 domain-containing protein [Chondromyces crocatus]AKT38005.1 uncharacterized protein CMC5_021460 [Chondromyces crocatus]